jgi:enoyl-CoA hydratase/carnithine racemase
MRVLGFSRTLEIFLTGKFYDSQDCLSMGLVNHVVDDDEIESYTYEMAGGMAQNAPLSLQGTKKILHKIMAYPRLDQEDEDLFETLFLQSLHSEDMAEGQRAFREKRKPQFRGK